MTFLESDASGFASTDAAATDDGESEDSDSESVEETTARSRSFGCDPAVACVNPPALRCVCEGTPRTKSLTPEGMERPTDPNDA